MLALVSSRTDLRRAGANSYFGLCPFHDERTGSFHVSPDEKHYHCFGCQASGDAVKFVEETEGLDFKGAIESLAKRFGVELETEDEDPAAAAAAHPARAALLAARPGRHLLLELSLGGARRPSRPGSTCSAAASPRRRCVSSAWATRRARGTGSCSSRARAGFSDEELLAVGLAQRSKDRPGSIYDRFRRADHVPLGRRPRQRSRLRRPGDDARMPADPSTSTPPTASSTTSASSCSGSTWPAPPPPGPAG